MREHGMGAISPDPFEQFAAWYKILEEEGGENYNAMTLACSSPQGQVTARIVLLKKYDEHGYVFFTNYLSRKGEQLRDNPRAALLFYWPNLLRQIRIEGLVSKVSAEESDEYFDSRVKGHKINALISKQSEEIKDKDSLIKSFNKLDLEYAEKEPVRPGNWGGYRLDPALFEFWQEGHNRLHDRLEYRLIDGLWKIRQLAP